MHSNNISKHTSLIKTPILTHIYTLQSVWLLLFVLSTATFRIPMAHFVSGVNAISLTFTITCNGQQQTIDHSVSLSVQLPAPSTFRVSNVRARASSPVANARISYTMRGDNVAFSVTITGEVVSLYGYSLNGGDTTFVGKYIHTIKCTDTTSIYQFLSFTAHNFHDLFFNLQLMLR